MLRDFVIAAVIVLLILAPPHVDAIAGAVIAIGVMQALGAVLILSLLAVGARRAYVRRRDRPPMLELCLGLVLAGAFAVPAHADTGGTIVEAVRPALTEFAVGVILALLALAYRRISAWTGIEIEARHREALQSALANGVRAAMAPGGTLDIDKLADQALDADRLIDLAAAYVERSVPDALKALAVDRAKLRTLLTPHVASVTALAVLRKAA